MYIYIYYTYTHTYISMQHQSLEVVKRCGNTVLHHVSQKENKQFVPIISFLQRKVHLYVILVFHIGNSKNVGLMITIYTCKWS